MLVKAKAGLLLALFTFLIPGRGLTQLDFGIKAGMSTSSVASLTRDFSQDTASNFLRMTLDRVNLGFQGGGFLRWDIGVLIVQPEIIFDYFSASYSVDSLSTAGEPTSPILSGAQESYFSLDLPLILALKFGPIRLGGGMEGRLHLFSDSDLASLDFYNTDFRSWSWGWEAGLGIDIWKLTVDARFEGSLEAIGSHQLLYEQPGDFSVGLRRFLLQLGFRF